MMDAISSLSKRTASLACTGMAWNRKASTKFETHLILLLPFITNQDIPHLNERGQRFRRKEVSSPTPYGIQSRTPGMQTLYAVERSPHA